MKYAYNTFVLLFTILLLSPFSLAHIRVCSIDTITYERELSRIDSFMPEPVMIEACTIKSDLVADDDLYGLLNIPSHALIDSAYLKKAIFYLIQKNRFKTIQVSFDEDSKKLFIDLENFWTFDRLKIKGIMLGKDAYKRLYLLQPGDYFDQGKHDYSVCLIKKSFEDDGYFSVSIATEINDNTVQKTKMCTLTITTGPLFKVGTFTIAGVADQEIVKLLNKLATQHKHKAYSKETVTTFVANAQSVLEKAGYYLINSRLEKKIHSGAHIVDLNLVLEVSGKRLFIFEGNTRFTQMQLKDRILLFGQSAWVLPLHVLAQEIQDLYRENLFPYAIVTWHQEDDQCIFHIDEGVKSKPLNDTLVPFVHDGLGVSPSIVHPNTYYFGRTVLQNGSRLPSRIILRELDYYEGDAWNQERVNESLARLRDLEIFDRVSLYPIPNPFSPDQKTMLLKVHEDDPYEIRLRLGAGLQQMSKEFTFKNVSYVAGGAFLVKNPFNYADQFRIDAEYTHGEQSFSARYTRPWIFDLPLKTSFEVYATQYLQPGLRNNQKNIYSFVQQGFLFGFNYKRKIIDAQFNTGIEWMETTVVDKKHAPLYSVEITRALNFEPLLVDRRIPYVLFEPTLVVDRLNNKLNPTHGSLGLFSLKGMFPLRLQSLNSFFMRIFIDQSVYLPVQKGVFAFRLRAGHIFYKDFKNVMPAERFYMGGANSIRSYETDMCPPLGTIVNDRGKTCFVPQGARSMITLNAEWRVPIYQNFWGAIFQDLGALSNNHFADIKAHNILAGTGFGFRYNTPIGPLRFDIAWKWHRPDPAISRYCWFLSFGNAF